MTVAAPVITNSINRVTSDEDDDDDDDDFILLPLSCSVLFCPVFCLFICLVFVTDSGYVIGHCDVKPTCKSKGIEFNPVSIIFRFIIIISCEVLGVVPVLYPSR
jgi:hypothetical protein